MAYLFKVEGNLVSPNTETLLIEPFSTIWERDTSENREVAIKEFKYIEFMTSHKKTNPYSGYSVEERKKVLGKDVLGDSTYEPDIEVEKAMAKILEFQKKASPTSRFYESALQGVEKLRQFFLTFDMNERNSRDQPLYKPGEITRALNDTDKVLQNLSSLKEKVEQELYEQTKTRNNKTINYFEQ